MKTKGAARNSLIYQPQDMISKDTTRAIPMRNRLVALDGLRALAALEVLSFHANQLLWQPPEEAVFWSSLRTVIAFPVRFGYEAVMLFLVLSGFVIHLRYAKRQSVGQANFDRRGFLLRRARRLYPTLLFALLFTFIVDRIGGLIAPEFYYPPEGNPFRHDLLTLLGHLLFLQHIVVEKFGTNLALWALSYIGWYYVLYALIYLPIRERLGAHRAFGFMLAASAVGAAAFTSATHRLGCVLPTSPPWVWHVVGHAGIWFMGAWLADCVAGGFQLRRPGLWLAGALLAILGLMFGHELFQEYYIARDWLWAGAFAVIILVVAAPHGTPLVKRFRSLVAQFAPLAPSSYTQYLIHAPLLVFVRILFLKFRGYVPSQPWLVLGMVLGIILLARALAPLIETPFISLGQRRQITE
jgi:peptidoglycan/LPS O-acetylase OafA/YrhL